jgi:hypothetical protein
MMSKNTVKRTMILWACVAALVGGALGYKAADISATLYFAMASRQANGWLYTTEFGRAAPPSLKAAAFVKHGMMANLAEEAVYFVTKTDVQGNVLDGANSYVVHFRQQDVPDVQGFWSLTMYHWELPHNLVSNPIDRYVISNRTPGLQLNDDGSFDVYIQHDSPGEEQQSNWLPAPSGKFFLTLRAYIPGAAILEGRYAPPAVTPVGR